MSRAVENERVGDTEVSLSDILGFLGSSWKLILSLTVVFFVPAVAVVLLLPQQYGKQVTLDVTVVPTSFLGEDAATPFLEEVEIGNAAVDYLQSSAPDKTSVSAVYDIPLQEVDVTLESESGEALAGAGPKLKTTIEDGFQKDYEGPLGASVGSRLAGLEREQLAEEEALEELERELQQTSSGGASDAATVARLEGLETGRANVLADISRIRAEQRGLERIRGNPGQLASELMSVEVSEESAVTQTRRPGVLIPLSLIASLCLALVAAVVWRTTMGGK